MAHGLIDAWLALLDASYPVSIQQADIIMPVPLSPQRLIERGFNQSCELAKLISKITNLPCKNYWLKRIHIEHSQAQSNKENRFKQLNNVFYMEKKHQACIKNQNILLVDDVMTSGATLHTIAKLLKSLGAQKITNWVALRTPTNNSYD
jgi:ComF family protein